MPSTSTRPALASAAVIAAALGVVHALRSYAPILLDVPIETVGLLVMGFNLLGFLLAPIALVGLAYWAETRMDVPDEYGRLAVGFGLAGLVIYPIGFAVVALVATDHLNPLQFVASFALRALLEGTWFAVAAVAGAATAHFQKQDA